MSIFHSWPCRLTLCMALFIGSAQLASANNIQVGAPTFAGRDIPGHFIQVRFDVSWENSWRTSTHQANWDAAWIFIKYRTHASYSWKHATLNYSSGNATSDGHVQPSGGTLNVTPDGKGAFLYASSNLSQQSVSYSDVQLRWNYGADGLDDTTTVELQVFAIEMVYVPQGSFYLGTGGAETYAFRDGAASTPFQVTSEAALGMNNLPGSLWAGGNISTGTLPADYPKGYKGFYCMKYEVTQGEYADFLNTLDRSQQQSRVTHIISGTAPSNLYAMTNTPSCSARNEITGMLYVPGTTEPLEYSSSYSNVACNFLSWEDAAAYADWAGLRPMSELEFEKACRGNDAGTSVNPMQNETAWGDTAATAITGISNAGMPVETSSNSGANCSYNSLTSGPVRVGAWSGGSRSAAGAGWYGILDMSGNVWEMVASLSMINTIPFSGVHGDGALDASGNANVNNWPYGGAIGLRGGSWKSSKDYLRVSDRSRTMPGTFLRDDDIGFRGVRTAP